MRKCCLFLFLIVIISLSNLYAQSVALDKAKIIGEFFVKNSTSLGDEKDNISSKHAYTLTSTDGIPSIYVFNIDGGGFVVVSAEERVKPILAYSTKGSFDASNIASGFNYTIGSYNDEIDYVRKNNIARTQDIANEWQMVENTGRITKVRNSKGVGPLVETTWNQNYPYNMLCPEDELGNGGHVYAGCVATAMAQVMRYWNHPTVGTGSHSYNPMGYPTQTANFGETYYNFENMPIFVDSLNTEEEIYDIALLQWHCGIAVNMMYGNDGSGAYSDDVPYAISSYFGYNQGYLDYQWSYSNSQWAAALKAELDLGHPLYYSGQDDSGLGGHAFVCDGYDEYDFFHFNWGWGGRDDAFCAIGALNTTKYAFNTWNAAVFDFYPITDDYYLRPNRITDLNFTQVEKNNSVTLSWTNPVDNMNGETLSSLDTVFVKRDFEVIAILTNVAPGETMTYHDDIGQPGLYEYSIYAINEVGNGKPLYESVLVGEKCDLVFEMFDDGGDGWKGGSISVFKDNERIAVVTMNDGSTLIETIPLLKGNLSFYWNKCWYKDEYYTCDEVSFVIKDLEGNVLYEDGENVEPGLLFEYDNNCISCNAPNGFDGEYVWESGDYAVKLSWNLQSPELKEFNIYRSEDNSDYTLVSVEPADNTISNYEYYDDVEPGTYYYKLRAVYENDGETCESEPALSETGDDYVMVDVTSIDENSLDVGVYPNPTDGIVNIKADGMFRIEILNIVGQTIMECDVDKDFFTIDMSNHENGIYFINVKTLKGNIVNKLILVN